MSLHADAGEKWERRASPHRPGAFVRADSKGVTGGRCSCERKATENKGVTFGGSGGKQKSGTLDAARHSSNQEALYTRRPQLSSEKYGARLALAWRFGGD